ncbi:hypothetical protein R5R35_002938 [Gryllus longicercus]|uniref:Elongation of very long chain fatty acids protein n=1 Tax=Gryllus longicercus TaxID=2509291 RepID=A0AAN9ZDJ7_9ORTH
METTWNALQHWYQLINYEWADPRAQPLPLVQRPFTILGLMAGYTLFVTRLGPWLMRDRRPYELKRTLIVYNALQILANLYIFQGFCQFWFTTYNWQCEPIDWSNSAGALEMLRLVNLYFWLKIADLLDTVFFVLRKKKKQITFLHVYHHSMMVLLSWVAIKFFPGGHATFLALINTLVHAIMYAYYLISAVYPHTIWWKKHVTQVQLFQHFIVGLHEAQLLVYRPCDYPLFPPVMLVPQAVLIIVLFLRFYRRAYGNAPAQAVANHKAKAS